MSYSENIKLQILSQMPKAYCCRRALACGIFLNALTGNDADHFKFRSLNCEIATESSKLLRRLTDDSTEIAVSRVCGRIEYSFIISQNSVKKLFKVSCDCNDLITELSSNISACIGFKCASCAQAFLRGVFLSTATISDLKSGFSMEFNIKDARLRDGFRKFLVSQGFEPHGKERLYFRKAEQISALLAAMGVKKESFDIINQQINRDIRNYENRVTNCLTRNIGRSISAAMLQVEAITSLMECGAFEDLDDDLKESAMLRLANPDISLSELALMHDKPITKSGLSHRLTKLVSIAKEKAQ